MSNSSTKYKNLSKQEQKQERIKRFGENQAERFFALEKNLQSLQTKMNALKAGYIYEDEVKLLEKEFKKFKREISLFKLIGVKKPKYDKEQYKTCLNFIYDRIKECDDCIEEQEEDIENSDDLMHKSCCIDVIFEQREAKRILFALKNDIELYFEQGGLYED